MKPIRKITAHIYKQVVTDGTITNVITGEIRPATMLVDTGETTCTKAYENKGRIVVKHDGNWYNVRYKGHYYIVL